MAILTTMTRTYICDRCGNDEIRGTGETPPLGWEMVKRTSIATSAEGEAMICRSCSTFLSKFFEGRKVDV